MARHQEPDAASRRRIAKVLTELVRLDLICSGTLSRRTKVCGKPNCRCAADPKARHGPYYEWSRREGGKLVHKILSPEQAEELERALRNHREVQRLLEHWERESAAIILRAGGRKS